MTATLSFSQKRRPEKLASVFHKKKNFELAAQNQEAFYHLPHVGDDFSRYDASGLDDAFPSIDPCEPETLAAILPPEQVPHSEKQDFAEPGDSLIYESPLSLFLSEDHLPLGRKTSAGI